MSKKRNNIMDTEEKFTKEDIANLLALLSHLNCAVSQELLSQCQSQIKEGRKQTDGRKER